MLDNIFNAGSWFKNNNTETTVSDTSLTINGNTIPLTSTTTHTITPPNWGTYNVAIKQERYNFHYTVNEDARTVSIAFEQRYLSQPNNAGGYNTNVIVTSNSSFNSSTERIILTYKDFYNLKNNSTYDVGKNVTSSLILAWIKDNHPEELV
jgi:hypothetical protein